ncbi:sterile alpha motif domain-containing protein 1 isoform X2 [Spodoptera frugiperda]|uniref:Sterile alpha motif domain-containing protein 1 isoform X2 n=1 Tax=Spodoptera frugiperda TaxID=7108 RepID=A0A9R0E6Y2_SPOFR|nr:sterile alpha motif domain-containing protein 1 isoform X2 [Spodoptera frugiperda]
MCDAGDLSAAGATGAMTAKYFVYGSGRWRAVDLESGRVAGWRRRARFVYLQRGRLQLARRGAVLRALRALAAGAPSAAADGPRLPTRSKEPHRERSPAAAPTCSHHCCSHCRSAPPRGGATSGRHMVVALPTVVVGPPAATSPVQHTPTVTSPPTPAPAVTSPRKPGPLSSHRRAGPASSPRKAGPTVSPSHKASLAVSSPSKPAPASSSPRKPGLAASSPRKVSPAGGERAKYRELVISDAELALVRGYVSRRRAGELARYDADERFRLAVLYSFNPVVRLRPLSAAVLDRYTRAAGSDTDDKENTADSDTAPAAPAGPAPRPQPAKRPPVSERGGPSKRPRLAERTNRAASPGLGHVISKRAGAHKEYSALEDHAIVAWLSAGERAAQVKGNAVWRALQAEYPRLAGRARSWHSLRNRYLRYILPALPALRLPPALQQRLRAAAAGTVYSSNTTATCATSCPRCPRCACRPRCSSACGPPPPAPSGPSRRRAATRCCSSRRCAARPTAPPRVAPGLTHPPPRRPPPVRGARCGCGTPAARGPSLARPPRPRPRPRPRAPAPRVPRATRS